MPPRDPRRPPAELQEPRLLNMSQVLADAYSELATEMPSMKLPEWKEWNRMTGGFRVREYTIFCGPTGTGKTTFLANMSAQLLRGGIKHFVMSVETGHTDYMKRVFSVFAGYDVNTGEPTHPDVLARLHMRADRFLESGLIEFSLYENRIPVEQLIHDLRTVVELHGCKIAFIDNLNFFMEVTRNEDSVIEMDRVTHELVMLCKQLDVHIVMVMHANKRNQSGRVESEWDIKGSSTAVQEAHNIFLFNRPRKEDVDSGKRGKFDRELTLNKMRRRGRYVGSTIVFNVNETVYAEAGFV